MPKGMHLTIVWTYAAVQSACMQCSVRPEFSQHYTRCMHTVPRSTACCAMDACSLPRGSHHTPALPHELLDRSCLLSYETEDIDEGGLSKLHIRAKFDHSTLTCSPPHVSQKFSLTLPPSTLMENSPTSLHMVGNGDIGVVSYTQCIRSLRPRISIYIATYIIPRGSLRFHLSMVTLLFK